MPPENPADKKENQKKGGGKRARASSNTVCGARVRRHSSSAFGFGLRVLTASVTALKAMMLGLYPTYWNSWQPRAPQS
eukprot:3058300-Rhodomonas_salina.1